MQFSSKNLTKLLAFHVCLLMQASSIIHLHSSFPFNPFHLINIYFLLVLMILVVPIHLQTLKQMNTNGPSDHQSVSIESVETSIQKLIRNWNRRQKWQHVFNPRSEQNSSSSSSSLSSRAAWRNHLTKFLESTQLRIIAISLLLLDLILTILELSSTLLSCSPNKTSTSNDNNIEKAWYHWVGISILALLSAKSVALAVGLGANAFFRRPGYVIDGVVVVGALVLEAFLEKKGGGLLVMVSLWRVVRVVESAMELSDEAIEAQIEGIVGQFEALRDENSRLLEIIAGKDRMIETLEKELEQYRELGKPLS